MSCPPDAPAAPRVREPLLWLSVPQMREVDRIMIDEIGISLLQMMENAGRNLAGLARNYLGGDARGRRVHVLAGPGGNGGGGLVAARHLHSAGAHVAVSMGRQSDDASSAVRTQIAPLRRIGVDISVGVPPPSAPDLVLDALLGYSQVGDPREEIARLIAWSAGHRVLALDTPSGLELDTATVRRPCVRAVATLTLALPKEGLRAAEAAEVVGDLFLADISVPPEVYAQLGVRYGSPFGRGSIVRVDAGVGG
jgi:NAD(P)H-hydrate epimerase